MGGEGSIQGMIISLRNNKKLLRKRNPFQRKVGFEKLRSDYVKFSQGTIESKTLSRADLLEIRKSVMLANRQENIWSIIISSILFIIVVGFGITLYASFRENQTILEQKILKDKTEKYLFYINEGDSWLQKEHWNNAIFQYLLAREIFPNEYDVNYRLVLAYGSKCKFRQEGCKEGMSLLTSLRNQFPEKKELQTILELFDSKGE